MSDNPMYWPGHQRPAWHQQPPTGQPVNTMSHYATHPGNMLGNAMAPVLPGDPSLQMQSSIPGRHQPHQSTLTQHQSSLPPPGTQSTLYPGMMPAPGTPSSARPTTQMTSNSHLSSATQGIPSHPSIQQPPHPQSHYPHQYSSLASSYWNPPPMNSQSALGAPNAPPGSAGAAAQQQPNTGQQSNQPDNTSTATYHSSSASPLTMPNENRGTSLSTNSSASSMQQSASSFHNPKDIQSSSDHMMSYDRQRGSINTQQQQQHPSAMMSQNAPSSNASNLSPTQSQMSMQARLQPQSQIDTMRSMSQQPSPASSWSSSYYGQPSQSPYSSVMNPYMPYPSSGTVPNHTTGTVSQSSARPPMGQKPPANGSERSRAAVAAAASITGSYPTHGSSMYGQPPPPAGSTNGSYYSYDSYYNQIASQATDPYLSHSNPASGSQHWPSSTPSNQMISNSPASSVTLQPPLRPQAGASGPSVHPQSPSASSALPSLSSRPPPPPSQTPDRSPVTQQHSTSYPSPNQPGSSSKSTSNSLAQLEQMVMPNSGQNPSSAATVTATIKSPTQRSSTNSPSNAQQQLQYSYNSSGQGSYFSTGAGGATNTGNYYPQYDSSVDMMKSGWSEQVPGSMVNPIGQPSAPVMMDSGHGSYGPNYETSSSGYGEYAPLTAPVNSCGQPRFSTPSDTTEPHSSEKGDPYAIDSQTFDDYDEQSSSSRTKKSRAKKGEEKVKKERKPRAPRAPKGSSTIQPLSPATTASVASIQAKATGQLPQTPVMSPIPQSGISSYPSPTQGSSIKPMLSETSAQVDPIVLPNRTTTPLSKSPAHRLSTESPQQSLQVPFNSNTSQNYYSSTTNITTGQPNYYSSYESSAEVQKVWPEQQQQHQQAQQQLQLDQQQHQHQKQLQKQQQEQQQEHQEQQQQQQNEDQQQHQQLDQQLLDQQKNEQQLEKQPSSINSQQSIDQNTQLDIHHSGVTCDNSANDIQMHAQASPCRQSPSRTPETQIKRQYQDQWFKSTNDSDVPTTETTEGQLVTMTSSTEEKPMSWSGPISTLNPTSSESTIQVVGHDSFVPPTVSYDEANAYGDYTSLSTTSNSCSQAQSISPNQALESSSGEPKGDNQTTDATDEQSAIVSKPKKSRAKKSGEKAKRERKSRAKPPQLPIEKPPSPVLPTPAEEPTQPSQVDQSTSEMTPSEPKPKRIRIRDSSSRGKKKLPKFALKFAKTKKRKRLGSSDNDQSDLDKTPPPSPDEVESGVQKRRSARNTKKLKYNDDIGLGFSDSDDESQILPRAKKVTTNTVLVDGDNSTVDETVIADEPTVFAAPVEDTMVVEKIMASRMGQRELEPEPGEVLPSDGTHIEVEEFYVKYKNLSYLHCDWRTLEELEKGDRRVAQKIKRYKQKKDSSNLFSFMDEDLFDPQYCEVDRILAVNEVEEMVPVSDEDENDEEKPKSQELSSTENLNELDTPNENTTVKTTDKVPQVESKVEKDDPSVPMEVSTENNETDKDARIDQVSADEQVKEDSTNVASSDGLNDDTVKESIESGDVPLVNKELEPVDQTVTEVDKPKKMKKKISRHYLVKWRCLSYEDSTWELEDDLDSEKIKHFHRFKDPPPKSKWKHVKRPKPSEWVQKIVSPVYKNNNTLREYQLEGINWLSYCWHKETNCILADEMGLGKTIQSIAFINEIYQYGINGPFLIIVPLSTVGNWAREFETWTDLNVITYHGSSTSREMLKEYEMFYRNEQGNRITSYYKFQVMITTFEIILSDCLDLREIPWRCCIIDEAHRLKNRNCKLLEGLRLLNMEHRVLLTGTPLQNNVEELFSLLNFLSPTQFSSTEQFLQEFGDLKTEAQVDKLKAILKPMMLRRLKEDVEKTLAPKEETIVEVELTNIQKKYYRAILEKNFSFLTKGSSNNNMPNLMNTMMELRKCCIHPYLINGAEEQILYEARQAKLAGGEPMSSFQAMVNSSGKLVLIDKLLPRLRADGHRVLIFSQMVRCLDILEDYVTHKHYPFERIDGRVRGSDRQQAIDRFSKPGSDRFVFLLCTRAGGLGINLTAADTVIIFDSDWNPQNDLQAQARCHRIGQSKAVKIYRLICRNTYEREMFDKASLKLGLDKAVLQSMNTQKAGGGALDGQLTKKEIEELLRKGAYGALMDDDNAGDKFCEEDIDQILQRRTQVITIDNSEAKGSTFSKATFSSSNNREDIELDDPNFWEKWAKKANIETDETRSNDELIQLAPRRRTQTKRYGADGNLLDISDLDSSEEDEETISMRTRGSRGRQPKLTPTSGSKRSKRSRLFEFEDEEFLSGLEVGYWSKSDCLKVEKGLLTYGWGRWNEIITSNRYKRELTPDECESICRVILLYCLNSYKGDEKIKSFVWDLITPPESDNSQSDLDSTSTRSRKLKASTIISKKTIAEEMADAQWPKEAKNDPLISLPDDQYRRHLQRNSNRLLIRVKFLDYLKNDILKDYHEKILSDCNVNEIDLPPVQVDGDLPASWWDDEADKSLLVGIFKHGHDKFSLMRQDPNLCFLQRCGPPNKEELIAEMSCADRGVDDLEDENRESSLIGIKEQSEQLKKSNKGSSNLKDSDAGLILDNILDNVVKDLSDVQSFSQISNNVVDENKNSILKNSSSHDSIDDSCENGVAETIQTVKMDVTDDESMLNEGSLDATTSNTGCITKKECETGEFLPFPSANDLNQRFRRLITAHQRNSKKLEIKLAQKARDELKKERTSKFEAAKNEREERKRFLAQKWSRREEADFFRAISSFGVEYDPIQKKHVWNKFRSIGKLDKKLDETLEEYYKAFIIMCKRVLSRPLTADEEKCPINVDTITEERALRCLSRIEFLNKIRENIITHPDLDERLKRCQPQAELPDWWENGKHDKDLLIAAAKHGLTRLDYNLAHDSSLYFDSLIRQRAENLLSQPPSPILIPLEQLQDLLERNGIEYLKDLDFQTDSDCVKELLNSLLDAIESGESSPDYKSFAELVDGPHSKSGDESLLAMSNSQKTPPKATRSSAGLSNLNSRPMSNILTKRVANTIVKPVDSGDADHPTVRLTSLGRQSRLNDCRVVEITPILPDRLPEELVKSFEAGEIAITIQSESAMLKLDDRAPIILLGATNPIPVKIRWPKDKAIQTRLENLVSLVENNEWPSPPRPLVPTITLPNHLAAGVPSTPLAVNTSPSKNEKSEVSLGSPKSDISNISSRTSKQDLKERNDELSVSRARRGRGRKPRPLENEGPHDLEISREDRQTTAKLRNLLSQGPTSVGSTSSSIDKLASKYSSNKQGAGLSSLLASFNQLRAEGGSSRGRDDKNLLDLNSSSTANLIPQILAGMKPEFRDLLANQDATAMLLNSLTNMTGNANLPTGLHSSNSSGPISIENLLNPSRSSSSKGPPPAHQRSDNPPSAHGSSSSRELRRSSQNAHENSPPSINLRSNRCKGSMGALETASHQKPAELSHGKMTAGKRRGRPSSSASSSPPPQGADVLDLSSLPMSGKISSSTRSESRSRRYRDQNDDTVANSSKSSSVVTKANLKAGTAKQPTELEQSPEKGIRTTRASKRIGSRIDALALNLQARQNVINKHEKHEKHEKRSPSGSALASSIMNLASQSNSAARPSYSERTEKHSKHDKRPGCNQQESADTSSSRRSSSSLLAQQVQTNQQSNQVPSLTAPSPSPLTSAASLNLANQFGGLNSLGSLLSLPAMNELMKQMSNFPGLAGAILPRTSAAPLLPNTTSSISNTLPGNIDKSSRRSRQSTGPSTPQTTTTTMSNQQQQAANAALASSIMNLASQPIPSTRSSYPERSDKHSKHDKRSGGIQQELSSETSSSRRSSSSLLNQQIPTSQQTSQIPTLTTPSPSPLTSSASLNLANQFGGLNSLGSFLSLPGMNELMKQMSNFPGLAGATLPRVSGAPVLPSTTSSSSTSLTSNSDKSSRRSRQSTGPSTPQTTTTTMSNHQQQQQQAANAALASSIMNLASQPNAAANPYGNYPNPLPFLPFGLGMNNPLGMGLFPNLYMPQGFPPPEQPQPPNQSGGSSDSGSKDKKMRFSRK